MMAGGQQEGMDVITTVRSEEVPSQVQNQGKFMLMSLNTKDVENVITGSSGIKNPHHIHARWTGLEAVKRWKQQSQKTYVKKCKNRV